MGLTVLRGLLNDTKEVQWFSIIADEATDLSHKEQLTLCVRWAGKVFMKTPLNSFMYLKQMQIHLPVS